MKYTKQLQALVKISEKVTLLIVGSTALAVSVIDPRFETLKLAVQASGAICLLFALVPMVWAYAKANWPTDKKK